MIDDHGRPVCGEDLAWLGLEQFVFKKSSSREALLRGDEGVLDCSLGRKSPRRVFIFVCVCACVKRFLLLSFSQALPCPFPIQIGCVVLPFSLFIDGMSGQHDFRDLCVQLETHL